MSGRKAARDRAIVAAYRAERVSQAELAERFGISRPRVSAILKAAGVDTRKRTRSVLRAIMRERWRSGQFEGVPIGRPRVWPDCPPHLRDAYRTLHRKAKIPAAEARAMLEGAA